MDYLFFFIYAALFCWLFTRIKFIADCGLTKRIIIFLFLIRIASGVINAYINLYYYPDTDVILFHQYGLSEYHLLFNDPKEYFTDIFKYDHSYTGILDITNSFWNNLRTDLIVKLLSVFNIFSFGNFFINTIFYNFLIFFGSVSFYKVFIRIFPDKKILLIISLFLLPSLIYFTSEIHKDGLIFLALGICCYNLFFLLKRNGRSFKNIFCLTAGLIVIFLLRSFVFITLIPAIIAWIIAEKNKRYALISFASVYVLFFIFFFSSGVINSRLNLPRYVSERQLAFVELAKGSKSAININPLYPEFRSFLNNTPQALNHVLMRPYLTEKITLLYIPLAIEIFILELLFILFLLFKVNRTHVDSFIYFIIFFSFSMLLVIGYTIPIIGAFIRYRSIYFPFLLIPIIYYIDWNKIKNLLINK